MKKAVLLLLEGSESEINHYGPKLWDRIKEFTARSGTGIIFRQSDYDLTNPPEVTMALGRVYKFMLDYHPSNNGHDLDEEVEEQTQSFRTMLRTEIGEAWKANKPGLKRLMKEVWTGKPVAEEPVSPG